MVKLNAKNICTQFPFQKPASKLYGPFMISEYCGEQAYQLQIGEP